MIITKIISLALDIQNCINIYTDPDNIKQILANRYEGKCISGCYVMEVRRVLRTGECVISQDGSPCFGVIPVIFEVTAVIYAVGEIINGCVVNNRDKSTGILVCSTGIAGLMVASHPMFESISKGQIISVRVVSVRYNISSPKIAVNAVPYLFSRTIDVYKIDQITQPTMNMLANALGRVSYEEEQMARLKAEKSKAWETFNQLLYAYREPQQPPAGVKAVDMRTIIKPGGVKSGPIYVSRDTRINLSTPEMYIYDTDTVNSIYSANSTNNADGAAGGTTAGTVVRLRADITTPNALVVLLEDYCAHLRTIREMVEIYSTEDILNAHRNLWQIFRKIKY
jgi:hypothetical protein